MAYKQFSIDYENTKLFINSWVHEKEEEVKGNVVIIHGMAEYSLRYKGFAEFLEQNGFNVYAGDHIGHGMAVSKDPENFYKYGMWPADGFEKTVDRTEALVKYIKSISKKPLFVFGHSLGSFLTTRFYEEHSEEANAYVICGSAYNNMTYKMSCLLTKIMKPFKSEKKRNGISNLLVNASANTLNKGQVPFADGYKSGNAWLSYNEENVKRYDQDKECGFPCDFYFFYSMFAGQQKAWKKSSLEQIKEKKPLFIIAGAEDPVGAKGKDVKNLYKFFKGYQDQVEIKLYPHMKHEVLNEDGKEEVEKDILNFYQTNM